MSNVSPQDHEKVLEEQREAAVESFQEHSTEELKDQTDFSQYSIPFDVRKKLFFSWANPKPITEEKSKPGFGFWYPANCSAFERKLIFKLDCFILSFASLSFFIKYLDSSNVSYAYVSGMQEYYNMEATDYVWLSQCFSINYAVFGVLGPLLLTKFRPNIVLPVFELLWSIVCILVITTKSYTTLMIVRGIQGALESVLYPSMFYILGTFYSKEVLVSRSAVYIFSGCVGPIVGGLLQSRVVSLDGKAGLAQWQWPFVIDFVISAPVAIFGYLVLPQDPSSRKPNFYLSVEEMDFIRNRTAVIKNVEATNKLNFGMIKRALSSWQFYVFIFAYVISQMTEYAGNFWSIVLKSQGYNIYDRNNIPTIQSGVKAVTTLMVGLFIDWRRRYCEVYAFLLVFWISGLAILVHWDVPRAAELYAYSIIGVCAPVSVIVVSWANEMTKEDKQLRALTLGCLNLFTAFATTPMGLKLFNTDFAPRYTKGMRMALGLACFQFLYNWVIVWFDRYQNRKRAYIHEQISGQVEEISNSSTTGSVKV